MIHRARSDIMAGWMLLFAASGMLFLLAVGAAALRDQDIFQFYADSITYLNIYDGDLDIAGGSLIGVANNYLGPMVILGLAGGNVYVVALLNILIFTLSIAAIARVLRLDAPRLAGLLMLSPLTISSLLSVNKELFFFPFLAFALIAHARRSLAFVLMAVAVSVLFRWQLLMYYVLLLSMLHSPRLVRGRGKVIVVLLLAISAIYVIALDWLEPVLSVAEASISDFEGGSGLFEKTLDYQKQGLYFLIFPIRAIHLLFGMGLRFGSILAPTDIYNDVFVSLHCLVSLILLFVVMRQKRLSLRADLIFAGTVFLALFCISPIFAPRYLYPVYVLLVLTAAGAPAALPHGRSRRPTAVAVHVPTVTKP